MPRRPPPKRVGPAPTVAPWPRGPPTSSRSWPSCPTPRPTVEYVQVANLQAFLDDQDKKLPDDFGEIRFVDPVARFTPTDLLMNALSQADEETDPLADELRDRSRARSASASTPARPPT